MAAALDPDQEPLLDSSSEQDKNGTSPDAVPSAPPLDEAEVSSSTGATPKTSSSEDHKKSSSKKSPLDDSDEEEDKKREERGAAFECNICLDVATDAVISMCGHLFCWPCLATWLETRLQRQICPVCKAGIGQDKVIPVYDMVYGCSNTERKDPRDKPLPPRPRNLM